jgi:rubrerythrin
MADSFKDALQQARKMEMDGIEFYNKLAGKCGSEAGRTMFRSFAADETRHLRVIKEIAEGMGVDIQKLPMPRETIRTIFAEVAGKVDDYASATEDEKEAIQIAMGMETKSYELYAGSAKTAKDDDMRDLFERLAIQENQHYEMLENTLEYLSSNDQWFLWKEGGLLTGDQSSLSE